MASEQTMEKLETLPQESQPVEAVGDGKEKGKIFAPTHVVALAGKMEKDGSRERRSLLIQSNPVVANDGTICFEAVVIDRPPELLALGEQNDRELQEMGKERSAMAKRRALGLLGGAAVAGLASAVAGCNDGGDLTTHSSDQALNQLHNALMTATDLEVDEPAYSQMGEQPVGAYTVNVGGEEQLAIQFLKPGADGKTKLFVKQASIEIMLDSDESGDIPEAVMIDLPKEIATPISNPYVKGAVYDEEDGKIYYSYEGSGLLAVCDYDKNTKNVNNPQIGLGGHGGIPLNIVKENGQKYLIVDFDGLRKISLDTGMVEQLPLPADCGGYTRLEDGTYLYSSNVGGYCLVTSGDTLEEAVVGGTPLPQFNQPNGEGFVSAGNLVALNAPIIHNETVYVLSYVGKTGVNGSIVGNYMAVYKPVGPVCGDGKCDTGEVCAEDCPITPDVVQADTSDEVKDTTGDSNDEGSDDGGIDDSSDSSTDNPDGDGSDLGTDGADSDDVNPIEPDTQEPLACLPIDGMPQIQVFEGDEEVCIPQIDLIDEGCEMTILPAEGTDKFKFKVSGDKTMECTALAYLDGFTDAEGDPDPVEITISANPDKFTGNKIWMECSIRFDKDQKKEAIKCPDKSPWTWWNLLENGQGAESGDYGAVSSGVATALATMLHDDEKTFEIINNNTPEEGLVKSVMPSGKPFFIEPGAHAEIDTLAEKLKPIVACEGDNCTQVDAGGPTNPESGTDTGSTTVESGSTGSDAGSADAVSHEDIVGGGNGSVDDPGGCNAGGRSSSEMAAYAIAALLIALGAMRKKES